MIKNSKTKFVSILICTVILFSIFQTVCFAAPDITEKVNSQAAVLYSVDTKEAIFAKNADTPIPMGVLSQIMTAVLLLESGKDLSETVTKPSEISNALFKKGMPDAATLNGEKVTLKDLYNGMMVFAASDCAGMIAYHLGGESIPRFVEMMNERGKALGMKNTVFTNVYGFGEADGCTTANDMAILLAHAVGLEGFLDTAGQLKYTFEKTNKHSSARTYSTTIMLQDKARGGKYYYANAIGVKTGFTNASGRVIATYARANGYSYIMIGLNAPTSYSSGEKISDNLSFMDAKALFSWGFSNYKYLNVLSQTEIIQTLKVKLCSESDTVQLVPQESFRALLDKETDLKKIERKVTLTRPQPLYAPVKEGEVCGYVELIMDGKVLAKVSIVTNASLKSNGFLVFFNGVQNFFNSLAVKISLIAAFILITAYIFITVRYNNIKAKRKKQKEARKNASFNDR